MGARVGRKGPVAPTKQNDSLVAAKPDKQKINIIQAHPMPIIFIVPAFFITGAAIGPQQHTTASRLYLVSRMKQFKRQMKIANSKLPWFFTQRLTVSS